jgi:hypothetical protein
LLLAVTAVVFVGLIALSLPIVVFALDIAAVVGLGIGGYPLEMVASSMIAGSQNRVLLAIPSFIFAGTIMERCRHVECARRSGAGFGRLVARRPRHAGHRCLVFLFRHLRLENGRGLGARLDPDAALEPRRLTLRGQRLVDCVWHRNGHAGGLFLAGFISAAVVGVCLCLLVMIQRTSSAPPRLAQGHATELALPAALSAGSCSAAGNPIGDPWWVFPGRLHRDRGRAVVALYSLLAARL